MSKSFFIDTTLCTACRGCQVACKQWHDLPAEITKNRGTYENPPDLSFNTYKVVRMREQVVDGELKWLFFPEQCRHCIEAPCLETAGDPSAIYRDDKTGAIIFTANTKNLDADEIIEACPYNIPRKAPDGTLAKCDMCIDRVENGLPPACVQTCPAGAMNFGDREEMLALAKKRLAEVKKTHPKAMLIDEDTVSVVYLVAYEPDLYCANAIASGGDFLSITRHMALKRMVRPLTNLTSRLL
jgi:formate dehydrogenase iron-sulfur subunit